ncbi:MAG: Hvo_1808 family surface protein [Halalkalicoccus sp.]|nr:Hvo_1808 family surface protein [Halalkalicoccus sp.]
MGRLAALLVAVFLFSLVGTPLAHPAHAQTDAEWREYEPDDDLAIDASDGLSEAELEAVVSRAMVRVEAVRGIEFEDRPPVTVVSRGEFRHEYAGLGGNATGERSAFENARLQALFLVGDDENATAVQTENMNAAVAGFYEPATGEIVVVSNEEEPRLNELTLAHELVHAYQDDRWGLANYDARTQDGSGGQLGLIEGDATYTETLYRERCGDEWECITPGEANGEPGEGPGRPANVGLLVLEYFPYDAGPAFVEAVHGTGGWGAVDAMYDTPPASTEQVIDPESYPEDDPREVPIEDTSSREWERLDPEDGPAYDRLGMGAITTMFVNPLYDSNGRDPVIPTDEWFTYEGDEPPAYGMFDYGSRYATGWAGDRLVAYENGDELGYVWQLAWDSPEDAETFAEGFDELLAYWGGEHVEGDTYVIEEGGYDGAYHVAVEGDTVTITHAPATDALTAVSAEARPGSDEGPPASDGSETDGSDGDGEELLGFGIAVALVALVVSAFVLARRR